MTLNTYADGDVLLASQLNADFALASSKHKQNQVGGTTDNTTTEQLLAEVLIPAGSFTSGALIIASGSHTGSGGIPTANMKLYTGTSATFGSNTERKHITRQHDQIKGGISLFYVETTEDWANEDIYVQITGYMSSASQWNMTVESLITIGVGDAV